MRFSEAPYLAFDTETSGVHWPNDRLFGFSIALPDGSTIYKDVRHEPFAIDWLDDEMSRFRGTVICHNASFDYRMADSGSLYLPLERLDDTAIRACLLNEHEKSFTLDHLAERYLGDKKVSSIYDDLAGAFGGRATRNVQMKNLHRADPSLVAPYAEKDALLTLRLWEWQEQEIEKQGIRPICDFERRVMAPIIKATMRGIRVDLRTAEQAMAKLTLEIDDQQRQLNQLIGHEINVNSPKQVREVFGPKKDEYGDWRANNGFLLEETESGNPSIDALALRGMEDDRRAELILSIRSTVKTRDTFLAGHVLGHAVGDRVYPNINQTKGDQDTGTGTGRLSYTDPALQQLPSRNKRVAAIVKPVFLPDEGCEWASLDASSYEVRTFAHLINNPFINAAYQSDEGIDFHQMVADLTGLPRNATYSGQANAKQLNLSMIFNSGRGAIAEKMGLPWEWASFQKEGKTFRYKRAGDEANAVIDLYHERLPGVKELADRAKAAAEYHGFVQTKHGRRLRFPRGYKSYKASGLAIQATAADLSKNMWLLTENMGPRTHLIMSVHDSFELNVPEGTDVVKLKNRLQAEWRESAPWFRVPLVLDLNGVGKSYWEASNG
jgi:DNA polymerase I-like protein with 3'-5' exonuclease and polymerase domains